MLNKKLLISMLCTLSLLGIQPALSAGSPSESERFELFQDPTSPGVWRVPIVKHFPTVEEMESAKKDYQEGELKLLGRPMRTIWGTLIEVDIDVSSGMNLLRRAAYFGHPEACNLLGGCFRSGTYGVPRNDRLADAWSSSSRKAKSLWEQSERYLKEGKEIPSKTLILPEIWGPIERARKVLAEEAARKEAERKRRIEEAAAAAEDIHLESKHPEEDDSPAAGGETDPLLAKGSELRRRRGASPTH